MEKKRKEEGRSESNILRKSAAVMITQKCVTDN